MSASKSNPRLLSLEILGKWRNGKQHLETVLDSCVAGQRLSTADRALVMELSTGQLRNFTLLDHWITRLRDKPVDFQTRDLLRLGLYQIFFTRIPVHAAVFETVAIAGRAKGVVNAVLRRASAEKTEIQQEMETLPAAIRYSHPPELIREWEEWFGPEAAKSLCAWNNLSPDFYVRVLTHRIPFEEFQAAHPSGIVHKKYPNVLQFQQLPWEAIREGLCYVQDPSTLGACELLAPEPGQLVLDACAAPGGKTLYLAELADQRARIVACDASQSRLMTVGHNVSVTRAKTVETRVVDWENLEHPPFNIEFQRILVDVPCGNSGVMRRRPDVRWRLEEREPARLAARQLKILKAAADCLAPGGRLVYSTCSIDPRENGAVVESFLAGQTGWRLLREQATRPDLDGVDGAYAALLTKPR